MRKSLLLPAIGLFVVSIILGLSSLGYAFKYTEVRVSSPGDLAKYSDSLQSLNPEALRIKGSLNSADIKTLRKLCGRDEKMKATSGTVKALDLSDVSFSPDGKGFIWYNNLRDSSYVTGAHTLPPLFLYDCNIEEIKLPGRLDTIKSWSLSNLPIKNLYVEDNVIIEPRAIALDSLLETLRLPFHPDLYSFSDEGLVGLQEVELNGFYTSSYSPFRELPNLKKVVFNGPMGYINATPFTHNPSLKSIEFNGPIFNTGTMLAAFCENLESITFNGPICYFGFASPSQCELPKVKEYTFNGPVFDNITEGDSVIDIQKFNDWDGKEDFLLTLARLAKESIKDAKAYPSVEYYPLQACYILRSLTDSVNCYRYLPEVDSIVAEAKKFDRNKSKIEILQESASYTNTSEDTINWRYAYPSDSLLTATRLTFNLDSIAGNGDDYSKIKNLTYWIHDVIKHNGMRPDRPTEPYDVSNIIEYARKDSIGANCRMMAIALQQVLLAEGIPARFLTCESKQYDTDGDCHVICTAWSKELDKWVWCDPTFAAFVTSPDGTPLHPGEVRQRLIDGEEVCLNEDANWNHENQETKEHYLDYYMAKNLYIISAYDEQMPRVEGPGSNEDNVSLIVLVPEGFNYRGVKTTSNEAEFWKKPY